MQAWVAENLRGREEPASWLCKDTSVSSSSKLVEIGWICPFGHTTHSLGGVRRSSPAKWLPLLPFHSTVAVTINWQFDGEMGRRRDDSAKLASVSAEQEEGARPNGSITAPVRQKPSHIGLQQRKRRKLASSEWNWISDRLEQPVQPRENLIPSVLFTQLILIRCEQTAGREKRSAQGLVRRLRVLLVILREPARACGLEASGRARGVYSSPKKWA